MALDAIAKALTQGGGADSGSYTAETLLRRQKIAEALFADSMKPKPIRHWAEGLAQMAQAGLGGYLVNKADKEALAGEQAQNNAYLGFLGAGAGGGSSAPVSGASPASPSPVSEVAPDQVNSIDAMADLKPQTQGILGNSQNAIAGIESGGRYDKLGPVTKTGDRAYGKYQVMGANIGPWTKEILGREMTPQEFLASTDAQDAVFNGRFGQYVDKYGPEGAAKAWFAGEGGMNNPNAADQLGTTVSSYASQFNKGFNPVAGSPQRPVQLAGAMPSPDTTDAQPSLASRGVMYTPPAAGASEIPTPANGAPMGAPVAPETRVKVAQALSAGGGNAVPAPSGVTSDVRSRIAGLLRSSVPQERALGRQLAGAVLQQQLKQQPKFHRLNDELLFDENTGQTRPAGGGFRPLINPAERAQFGIPADDRRPYQVGPGNKLINPPPENRISIDQRGESSFDVEAAKSQAKRFDELAGEGQNARQMVSDINTLVDLGRNLGTGKGAEIKAALGPWAESLGIKVDGLSDIQAFEALTNRMAPALRVKGSGAQSDFELKNFLKSLPTLGNTPEGNEIASSVLRGLYENKIRASEIGSRALNKEISRTEAEKMLREMPDPMDPYRAYMKKTRGGPSAAGSKTSSGIKWSVE